MVFSPVQGDGDHRPEAYYGLDRQTLNIAIVSQVAVFVSRSLSFPPITFTGCFQPQPPPEPLQVPSEQGFLRPRRKAVLRFS